MGLQTLKCFIYGDIAKHQQTEKEMSLRPCQAMARAHHATLFFLSFFSSSNCQTHGQCLREELLTGFWF